MSYGYQRSDPVKLFADRAGYYMQMIQAAEQQGFTRQEAIEILKVDNLHLIESAIGNRY